MTRFILAAQLHQQEAESVASTRLARAHLAFGASKSLSKDSESDVDAPYAVRNHAQMAMFLDFRLVLAYLPPALPILQLPRVCHKLHEPRQARSWRHL